MDARRVDADSSGARDGVARLSVRPPPGCRAAVERGKRLGRPRPARPPRCIGEISVKDRQPLQTDLVNLQRGVEQVDVAEAFMNAASPGVIALFQPNDYYPDHEAYLEALGEAMRVEYEGIVDAGFLLQVDAPDIGMGRHTIFRDKSDDEYLHLATLHIEVLNHSLRNIAADRVRPARVLGKLRRATSPRCAHGAGICRSHYRPMRKPCYLNHPTRGTLMSGPCFEMPTYPKTRF